MFRVLTESKHSSLFWGSNADLLLQNAILYGPLSLCNSNEFIRDIRNPHKIQFVNFHYNGVECRWNLEYNWGIERAIEYEGTTDAMEVRFNYHHHVDFHAVGPENYLQLIVLYLFATIVPCNLLG